MKKTLAILLALCLLIALSGCVSESDVEAAAAQRDAVQEELDALQEQYDALQNRLEQHSEYIRLMEEKKFDAVLDKLEEMQAEKEKAAAEMIEPYLVTVELTMDNFGDYFEWKWQTVTRDNGEDVPVCYLASKVYEQGLILYKSDAVIGVAAQKAYGGHLNIVTDPSSLFHNRRLHSVGSANDPSTVLAIGSYRVEGTVTFVKAEAVTDYKVSESEYSTEYWDAHISLINGEWLWRSLLFGEQF